MSLQHSQFVENRVYDDDDETVSAGASTSTDVGKETKRTTLVDALQHVLNSGVDMMDKYYERVSFDLSDDEDEADGTSQKA